MRLRTLNFSFLLILFGFAIAAQAETPPCLEYASGRGIPENVAPENQDPDAPPRDFNAPKRTDTPSASRAPSCQFSCTKPPRPENRGDRGVRFAPEAQDPNAATTDVPSFDTPPDESRGILRSMIRLALIGFHQPK